MPSLASVRTAGGRSYSPPVTLKTPSPLPTIAGKAAAANAPFDAHIYLGVQPDGTRPHRHPPLRNGAAAFCTSLPLIACRRGSMPTGLQNRTGRSVTTTTRQIPTVPSRIRGFGESLPTMPGGPARRFARSVLAAAAHQWGRPCIGECRAPFNSQVSPYSLRAVSSPMPLLSPLLANCLAPRPGPFRSRTPKISRCSAAPSRSRYPR